MVNIRPASISAARKPGLLRLDMFLDYDAWELGSFVNTDEKLPLL